MRTHDHKWLTIPTEAYPMDLGRLVVINRRGTARAKVRTNGAKARAQTQTQTQETNNADWNISDTFAEEVIAKAIAKQLLKIQAIATNEKIEEETVTYKV